MKSVLKIVLMYDKKNIKSCIILFKETIHEYIANHIK